jgi:hypothetical protein
VGTGEFYLEIKQSFVKLTTHLPVRPRLGMCGAIPPLPHASSWHGFYLSKGYVFMMWYEVKHRQL